MFGDQRTRFSIGGSKESFVLSGQRNKGEIWTASATKWEDLKPTWICAKRLCLFFRKKTSSFLFYYYHPVYWPFVFVFCNTLISRFKKKMKSEKPESWYWVVYWYCIVNIENLTIYRWLMKYVGNITHISSSHTHCVSLYCKSVVYSMLFKYKWCVAR